MAIQEPVARAVMGSMLREASEYAAKGALGFGSVDDPTGAVVAIVLDNTVTVPQTRQRLLYALLRGRCGD